MIIRKPRPYLLYKNVYIIADGSNEYGKKIICYFERLGGINYADLNGFARDAFYFINKYNNTINMSVLKPDGYKEIAL